jgi:phage terminase large subunit-like protein
MATAISPFAHAADILDPPDWQPQGRPKAEPHQIPPAKLGLKGGPKLWLLEAGRGAGKTEACARYYCKFMRQHPGARGRIIAPTFGDAVEACVRGPSGVLNQDPEVRWVPGADGGSKLIWPGGAEALVMGTPFQKDVERLRATGNRHIDWWEEMAANTQLEEAWDQAALGLRLGEYPHAIASTTPRSIKAYRAIRDMDETELVNGISMFANPHNPQSFIDTMKKKYDGTRLGRQELYGELLEDVIGALWTRISIEYTRVTDKDDLPDMVILVIAVDPAATSSDSADDTGIVVCGLGTDGCGYVLEDATCHLPPSKWGNRVVDRYEKWDADYVVGEVNNGGEMVEHVIATVNPDVPFKGVHASRGKATRAQPIASLYGDYEDDGTPNREGTIRHVGGHPELEDQMCTWVPGDEDSPDNMDALVWGMTEIFLEEQEETEVYEEGYEPRKIGATI